MRQEDTVEIDNETFFMIHFIIVHYRRYLFQFLGLAWSSCVQLIKYFCGFGVVWFWRLYLNLTHPG